MKYGTWPMDVYGFLLCGVLVWQSYDYADFGVNFWIITPFWVIVGCIHAYDVWKRRIAPLFKRKEGHGE